MSSLTRFIQEARAGTLQLTRAERLAINHHRAYMKLRAKDPDYYTKQRRMERKRGKGKGS